MLGKFFALILCVLTLSQSQAVRYAPSDLELSGEDGDGRFGIQFYHAKRLTEFFRPDGERCREYIQWIPGSVQDTLPTLAKYLKELTAQ